MKITKLELIKVKPRWMFLQMYTDEGIVGLGEPILEGHTASVEMAVREFESYLIGKDSMQIEHHLQAMYRGGFYRGGPVMMSAISGIEQAMWDIKGKYYGCPVYELLGGKCRDKIRMYTHIKRAGVAGDFAIEEMLDITDERLKDGYTALKYSIIPPIKAIDNPLEIEKHIERFARVREKIGKEINVQRLKEIFLELQSKGANNINLVTGTHYIPQIAEALQFAKAKGLMIPIVYNTGGYEKKESLRMLEGLIDIYLPDMKYVSRELSKEYSNAPDYFEVASKALEEMVRPDRSISSKREADFKEPLSNILFIPCWMFWTFRYLWGYTVPLNVMIILS